MITPSLVIENHIEGSKAPAVVQESVRLLDALKRAGLRFAHWKSNSHLAKGLEGKTDLDILVHPSEREAFEQCMKRLGYKELVSQPWSSYPDVEDWLGMDEGTGRFLHLHVHYALVTGIQHVKHLCLPWIDTFFNNTITEPETGWPIPRPELEVIILFVRIWAKMPVAERLKKSPRVPAYVKDELLGLLRQSDFTVILGLCQELRLEVPDNFAFKVNHVLVDPGSAELLEISKSFYAQLKQYYRSPWPLSVLKSVCYKLLLLSKKRSARFVGPHRFGKTILGGGKVIALVGSDGSGKSTISKDLIDWLSFKLDTHYLYLGKRPFIKSYKKNILSYTDVVFQRGAVAKAIKTLIGNSYYIMLINRKLDILRVAKGLRDSGSVIVCDRFPQKDIYGLHDGPKLLQKNNGSGAALEMELFGKAADLEPDLVIKLIVSPEVASQRKPGHSPENIRTKCESIERISFKRAKVVAINTQGDYSQTLLSIKKEIWNHL